MRRTQIKPYLSTRVIQQRMGEAESLPQFRRWQVILLRLNHPDWTGDDIAKACGISCNTVYQWVWMYNKYGPDEYILKGRGGRRNGLLSQADEKKLLLKMVDKAEQGQVVTAQVVKREVEKQFGKKVSKDYAYDLLHRHNWRKIKPRPHHPKRDLEVQAAFKKTSKTWWTPPA